VLSEFVMGGGESKGEGGDDIDELEQHAQDEELVKAATDIPFARGHPLLAQFADALEAEYVQRQGPACGDFLDNLDKGLIEREGVKAGDFDQWTKWVEALMRRSYLGDDGGPMTIDELKRAWGVGGQPAYAQAQPVTGQPVYAQATPVGGGSGLYPGCGSGAPIAHATAVPSSGGGGAPVAMAKPI